MDSAMLKNEFEELIEKAVMKGMQAGKNINISDEKQALKATEKRLLALPILKDKVAYDKEKLKELEENGLSLHSTSLVRFQGTGSRVKPDEMLDAMIQNTKARIAMDTYEIATMERALKSIENDPYYQIIPYKYLLSYTDEKMAEALHCDPSTIRRNKSRLLRELSIFLYGVQALS